MGSYGFICFVHIIQFPVIIWSNRILGYGQIRGIDTTNQLVKQNCLLSHQHLRNHSAGWLVEVNRSAGIWVFVHQGWTRVFLGSSLWTLLRGYDVWWWCWGWWWTNHGWDHRYSSCKCFSYSKRGGFPANLAYLPKRIFLYLFHFKMQ